MITTIIICALFAYGMFTIQRPGFLLDFLRPMWKLFPKGLHEPLFECGVCTASIWGSFAFLWMHYVLPYHWLLALPIIVVACSGIQAFLDRAVKAFEKTYGYKPAPPAAKKWDYLLPYEELRTMLSLTFVAETKKDELLLVEVGGHHDEWQDNGNYLSFDQSRWLSHPLHTQLRIPYNVIILGLAFDGDLRLLRKLIVGSNKTFIEYSDDGISRHQVELLTEGLHSKLLIPEYDMVADANAPKACGVVTKRKVLIIDTKR